MQRQTGRLFQHSSPARFWSPTRTRAADAAILDRYVLIRSFFRQCRQDANHRSPCANNERCMSSRTANSLRICRPSSSGLLRTDNQFRRFLHSSLRVRDDRPKSGQDSQEGRRTDSGPSIAQRTDVHQATDKKPGSESPPNESTSSSYSYLENYPRFFKRLAMSLPPMHRPTKDDFLKVTTNFWQRLRIRFKWFTVRSFRKFNADDISAFITWFLMSQTLWILVGTTTFFSVVFATANSLSLQENVARAISNYLTSETGIMIVFESAIVPKWKDSRISFKNVYISCRSPSSEDVSRPVNDRNAGHRAAAHFDPGTHPADHIFEADESPEALPYNPDANFAMFDLNVDSIDVTLSLARWLDGKGLVADAVVKGVRGVLDRRHIKYDPDQVLDLASFRHVAQPGDFELESLQLEDVLITVYQPGSFRPYTASIFSAELKRFRKRWMFFDFLSAENIVGQFDNCLFSLHKPQSIGRTTEQDMKDSQWARMSRIRIDGVNIDHLQAMTTQEGPISWITSGKLDAVLDIKFPRSPEDLDFNVLLGEIADAISSAASSQAALLSDRIPGQRELAKPAIKAPEQEDTPVVTSIGHEKDAKAPTVVSIDIDLRFRDLKAAVPLFTRDLSYVNNALIRPIVAFINANRTLVPIHCRVIKDLSEFDGAWTMWETGLMDAIAIKVYDALAYYVTQANFNRRLKTVSLWSLQKTASAVISALKSTLDARFGSTMIELT